MAVATVSTLEKEFDVWLRKKLVDLDTDDEVFSPYILGILDSDDSEEEKLEALEGILAEIMKEDIKILSSEIYKKWSSALQQVSKEEERCTSKIDVEKLAQLMGETKLASRQTVNTHTAISLEKQKLKEAILAQYAEVSDGEVTDEDDAAPSAPIVRMEKNMNVASVVKAEREKREKEKEDSQKKKEKDKEDRAKQKLKDDERKEKEKKRTQKGERRR